MVDAERLLGTLLADVRGGLQDGIVEFAIRGGLSEKHLGPIGGRIWRAIKQLKRSGRPFDLRDVAKTVNEDKDDPVREDHLWDLAGIGPSQGLFLVREVVGRTLLKEIAEQVGKLDIGDITKRLAVLDEQAKLPAMEDFERVDYSRQDILIDADLIVGSGYFENYLRYVEQTTDAPREFLFCSMLVGVAGILGNKVYVRRGRRVYPNVYCLLIGPSTIVRKSTALDCAEGMISELGRVCSDASGLLFPNTVTPEAFYEHLAERRSYGFWKVSEFGSFLKGLGRTYMQGFKEDLTDFYDVPAIKTRTRKAHTKEERDQYGGKFVDLAIQRPAISLCAGSTIEWFRNNLEESDVGGGWLARFVFSVLEHRTTDKIAWPEALDPDAEEGYIRDLTGDLYRMYGLSGEYAVRPEAKALYERWYEGEAEALLEGFPNRAEIEPFVERYATVALKLAMILQASKNSNMAIDKDSMRRGIGIAEYFIQTVNYLLSEQIATGWTAKHCRRFIQILKEMGGIGKRRDVQQRIRELTAQQFEQVAETLVEQGKIEELEVQMSEMRRQNTRAYKLL